MLGRPVAFVKPPTILECFCDERGANAESPSVWRKRLGGASTLVSLQQLQRIDAKFLVDIVFQLLRS
jgi:hypothetical protein